MYIHNVKSNPNEPSELLESEFSDISNLNNNLLNSPTQTIKSHHKDSIKKYDSSLNVVTNDNKPSASAKRRNSQGNCHKKIDINNFAFSFKVDKNFLPLNKCNFILDINSMSYIYYDKIKNQNNDSLLNNLFIKAKEKISLLRFTQTHKNNDSNSLDNGLISDSNSNLTSSSSSDSNSQYASSNNDESSSNNNNKNRVFKSFLSNKEQINHDGEASPKRASNFKNKTSKTHFKKSIKDQPLYEKISNQLREKKALLMSFHFYEVNLKNIMYLKYDFYKEMIIEDNNFEKISKVTEVINELKTNDNTIINKDDNYPYINISQIITMKKKSNGKKDSIVEKKKKHDSKNKLDINKIIFNKNQLQIFRKSEKEKKIDEALNKRDKQYSIIHFIFVSIFCLLILYAIGGVNLYFYLREVSRDKENVKLICDSTNLKFFFHSAIYYIRELTLLYIENTTKIKDGEYIGYPSYNKSDYNITLINKVLDIYSNIHNLNENITATELPLSDNTSFYLNDKEFIFEVLDNNYTMKKLRTSLSNSIMILDSYLYNLAEFNSIIKQSNEDVFPFIHNTLNNVGLLLNDQIELYMNEIDLRAKNNKIKVYIILGIIFVLLILIFLLTSKAYNSVIRNKANFFYIFYGIRIETIHQLINNCESFLQKLKKDQKVANDDIDEERNEDNEEESSFVAQKKNNLIKSVLSSNADPNYNTIDGSHAKDIKDINLKKKNIVEKNEGINYKFSIKLFNYCFFCFCLIVLAYFFLVINNYISFVQLISEYVLYNYHLQNYHINIIQIINAYREFLFDDNTIINGTKANDYIDNKMNDIYSTKFYDNIIFNKYRKKIPGFLDIYNEFHSHSLCSRRNEEYFSSDEDCQHHMQGISTYGFSVVHTSITEEIRIYKNMVNQLLLNNSIIGNLTLYGSKIWNDKNITDELNKNDENRTRVYYRLYLFNNNSFHKDINILYANAIYPYIDEERIITIKAVNDSIKNKERTYIIFLVSFFVVITLLFFIYWIPLIKNMNVSIYKTKKILSIIPLHILASQSNINMLLNIGGEKSKLI